MLVTLDPSEIKAVVQVAALALILFLETTLPLFRERRDRVRHITRNLGIGLLNGLILAVAFAFLTSRIVAEAEENRFGFLHLFQAGSLIEGGIALLLFDLWMYLWHQANHRIPFLWRFHRMHHSDDQVDSTTALRFHIGELVFSSILRLAVVPLIGMSLGQLILYETLLQPIILFHHSNVALPEKIDRIFRAVIVTPNMHRVHHSQINQETNSNYASIFSFWDRIGRSFHRRIDILALKYGLPDFPEPKWQTFIGMLKTPLK